MSKKLLMILIPILILGFLGCPPPQIKEVKIEEGIEIDGLMNLPNALTDTLIDEALHYLGEGDGTYDGFAYFWLYHKYYEDSVATGWYQLTNTHADSGGGDTAVSYTMSALYTADNDYVYDSIFRLVWTYAGAFTDSATVWFCAQTDTTVLDGGESVMYDWTLTASAAGTAIADLWLYHLLYGFQAGSCQYVDTMDVIWRSGDTNAIKALVTFDFTNDSLFVEATDTARDANDTINRVRLKDNIGGSILANKLLNIYVAAGSTPHVNYHIGVTEH